MGFLDFFKKKKQVQELEKEIERIIFDNLRYFIDNKRKEIEKKEKEIFVLVKNKSSEFTDELNEGLGVLESVDIDSKKVVGGKIKLIIKENLNNYLGYVKKLIENINELEEEKLDKLISKINKIFLDFEKKSFTAYQKVNFVVGKEVTNVKNIILNFSKYLKELFSKNKDVIGTSKVISLVESKLDQINEINKTTKEVDEKTISLDSKIESLKKMNEKNLEEIEKIKTTEEYQENLKNKDEINSSKKELEKEIYGLKNMIDFKDLGNIYHVNKNKMEIIKFHKDNFLAAFNEDYGESLSGLIDQKEILDRIEDIRKKKESISEKEKSIKKDETEDFLDEVKKVELEIENLRGEKSQDLKRSEKLKINRGEIKDLIKKELEKVGVEVI